MNEQANKRLMRALEGTYIREMSHDFLLENVFRYLKQVYVMVGFANPDRSDMILLGSKIAADLMESYGFLTIEEVAYCFEMGAKGLLCDFNGINMRTVTRWLK